MTSAERIAKAARLAAPVFVENKWTWGWPDSEKHIPSSEEIAQTIARLYDNVLTNQAGSSSSGRLHVYLDEDDGSVSVDIQLGELRDAPTNWTAPEVSA